MKLQVVGLLAGAMYCAVAGPGGAQDAASFSVLRLAGNYVHWQKPADGKGLVVTYQLVSAAVEFPGARNCRKMTSLDQLLADSELSIARLREEIAAAFAMWEAAANISFREAPQGARADILIGAQAEPEGWAFADVFYDTASAERIKPISQSLICMNPTKRWKIGFDGDLKVYDLRYTITHEIGHAIGLDHPTGSGEIMGYRYEERFRSLQPGDKQGVVLLYGERNPAVVHAAAERSGADAHRRQLRFAKRWVSRAISHAAP